MVLIGTRDMLTAGGGGDGHELSLSTLTWWPAGHEPWPNTGIIALLLPAETRTLIAALERARDRADPAAAEQF